VVAAALAVVFIVLLPASITSAWIRGTILSTSGYVAAVAPLAASPTVRAAVKDAVTAQVEAALSHAETSLPRSTRALAGRLGTGLVRFIRNWVGQLMASQAFQRLWADVNRFAHSQIIGVLNGDSALVTATGGEVVLNLLPLVNEVMRTVAWPLSAVTGHTAALPPVTTIPAAACHARTGTAASACTQIPLFPATALAGPRHVYRIVVAVLSLVLILTTLAFAGALAASQHRRRTLLQMTIGGTLTVLAVMSAASYGRSSLIDRAAPRYQPLTSVIVHAFTAGFFTMSIWCVVIGFAITAIALLSGPYRWATAIRTAIPWRHQPMLNPPYVMVCPVGQFATESTPEVPASVGPNPHPPLLHWTHANYLRLSGRPVHETTAAAVPSKTGQEPWVKFTPPVYSSVVPGQSAKEVTPELPGSVAPNPQAV
jgi:hypothetical protein